MAMPFDQSTRNRLQRFVSDARTLLTEEFTRQLQQVFGLDPDTGEVTDIRRLPELDDAQRETCRLLRDTLEHYLAASPSGSRKESLQRIVREQAFTVLNRLSALRMAEARQLLVESVTRGYQAKGFQLYWRLAGTALGETGDAYRCYLFSLFDEFAVDLPVLFDRYSPQGRLFPRESALLSLLDLINHADIEPLWGEDETIGWIYQYFNSAEERRQMRAESAAPRNSRELAVRNQFFTPRYVVEFLTDNTLGRIWYEMTKGRTTLKDTCRYLVRRPNEIFLAEGELPPNDQGPVTNDISQEELLKQPVHIPHRPLKDPREIKMLDPACGSMHFGLYAFDLFETIYAEAWDLQAAGDQPTDHGQLTADYPSKPALLRDVPRLIIQRNIHGIDIDPRAVQIAGLSLWLRAQKSWQAQGLKPQDRPQIERSNVVCAEPMPGEESLLQEFLDVHLSGDPERQLLGQLVRRVFEAMKLAGEAGSLLKIEEEIATSVAEAKKAWLARPEKKQRLLFDAGPKLVQQELGLDVSGITDEAFWAEAEDKNYAALRAYAEHAENGGGYQRRLFADDAARGFAFIDVCRKRYDSVIMNPPFGEPTGTTRTDFKTAYPSAADNLAVCFLLRAQELLAPNGRTSSITDCSWAKKYDYSEFRATILENENLCALVHLGWGILDNASVETNLSVRGGPSYVAFTIRLAHESDKAVALAMAVENNPPESFCNCHRFRKLPNCVFAFEMPDDEYAAYAASNL